MSSTDARHPNIWYPFSSMKGGYPVQKVVRTFEEFIYLEDGRKLIDGISSWWVNIHGHSHPTLAQAIYEQALQLEHVIFAGFTHEPAEQLAETLCHWLPNGSQKIFFSDNGSTATEVALKMAVQLFHNEGAQKINIIALEGAYHGDTFGAMAVGARDGFTTPFHQFFFDVHFLPFPDSDHEELALERLEALLEEACPSIFIFEPLVQGASGMRMYTARWLNEALQRCHKHQAISIADEVFTGFGRTGRDFASNYLSHQPDIICLSKGITGGILPLGVTAANQKIVKAFEDQPFETAFLHGHSFTANPLVVAAANQNIALLKNTATIERVRKICSMQEETAQLWRDASLGENPRALGTILAVEAAGGEGSGYFNTLRDRIYQHFLSNDILLRPLGRTIYTGPPYSIREESLQKIHTAIHTFLKETH